MAEGGRQTEPTSRDLALAVLVNVVFGLNFVTSKIGVDHFPPIFFTALRFVLVALVLVPYIRFFPGRMKDILKLAFTVSVVHFTLTFTAMHLAQDVSTIALVGQLYVPFATLLAVVFLGERVSWVRSVGIAIAFLGVGVIGFDPAMLDQIDALIFSVLGALAMGVGVIFVPATRGIPVLALQGWMAVIALPPILLLSMLAEAGQVEAVVTADWLQWVCVAFAGIGASVLGHGAWYFLLKKYPVSLMAPILMLTPVLGVLFGVTLLGDALTVELLLGGALILAGVALILIRRAAPPASPATAREDLRRAGS